MRRGPAGWGFADQMKPKLPHPGVMGAPAYTAARGDGAPHPPIADFLIKPFQRDRFTLAVDRGRQWRKLAIEDLHWHAMLAIELRDRAVQILHAVSRRARAGVSEADALMGPMIERIPDVAADSERVARY